MSNHKYSYETIQTMSGRQGTSTNQQSTIGRNIYGQCLFIGWAAMVVHLIAGIQTQSVFIWTKITITKCNLFKNHALFS